MALLNWRPRCSTASKSALITASCNAQSRRISSGEISCGEGNLVDSDPVQDEPHTVKGGHKHFRTDNDLGRQWMSRSR